MHSKREIHVEDDWNSEKGSHRPNEAKHANLLTYSVLCNLSVLGNVIGQCFVVCFGNILHMLTYKFIPLND